MRCLLIFVGNRAYQSVSKCTVSVFFANWFCTLSFTCQLLDHPRPTTKTDFLRLLSFPDRQIPGLLLCVVSLYLWETGHTSPFQNVRYRAFLPIGDIRSISLIHLNHKLPI